MTQNQAHIKEEVIWTSLIFIFAALAATVFLKLKIVPDHHFYQETYAPAAMLACGKGFIQPVPETPQLTDFLAQKSMSFDCATIPAEQKFIAPSFFQIGHRNLQSAVALWWNIYGINWNSLTSLYALLYGITAALCYLILRTAAARPLALAVAILFIISPPQLFNLPHLRDYSKAPFMLAAILAIALLLKGGLSRRSIYALTVGIGATIGFGIGFRVDLLIIAPLLLIVIIFFQPGALRDNLSRRLIEVTLFVVPFAATSAAILMNLPEGGNTSHLLVLGLMREFDTKLQLNPAFYSFGYHYLDMYANTLISAHENQPLAKALIYPTVEYDRAGFSYLMDVYKNFPADMFTRFMAATWNMLKLPVVAPVTFEDVYRFYDDITPAWLYSATHLKIWNFFVAGYVVGGAYILYRHSARLAIGTTFTIFYLCGYPFLQFGVRHYFFLEIIGLWFLALCIQHIFNFFTSLKKADKRNTELQKHLQSFALNFFAPIFTVLVVVGLGLRIYQSAHLKYFFEKIIASPAEEIEMKYLKAEGKQLLLAPPTESREATVHTRYFEANFDLAKCNKTAVNLRTIYKTANPAYDFSENISISNGKYVRYIFPAFDRGEISNFKGLELLPEDAKCLVQFSELKNWPNRIPMMLELPDNWETLHRYRTFGTYGL